MTRVLAVCNQKGGVGKTTTAVNLAATLARARRRVLLVDLDPQGNATTGCGLRKAALERTVADVLLGEADAASVRVDAAHGGFALLPGGPDLTAAELALLGRERREYRLREALAGLGDDYVLIDCPPALNILAVNALVAADAVLVPTQCEYYALEGLDALLATVERIGRTANPGLRLAGVLRTMYDTRNNLAREVSETLCGHFGDRVFRTVIPRNVTLAEAPSHGMPVTVYRAASPGATAYLMLAGELLRREEAAG